MSDLTEFLLARIAEDEKVARAEELEYAAVGLAAPGETSLSSELGWVGVSYNDYPALAIDATRVLAECKAKRLVLTLHEHYMSEVRAYRSPRWQEVEDATNVVDRRKAEARGRVSSDAVQALAQVYADHPDFLDEWRWDNR